MSGGRDVGTLGSPLAFGRTTFVRTRARHTVKDHRKAVTPFSQQAKTGSDPDTKAWASMTLPTLEQHLGSGRRARVRDRLGPSVPSLDQRMAATRAPDRWPVIRQEWRHLCFVHWVVDADAVRRLLPPGLEVDTFEDKAYVGLVPFTVRGTRPPLLPPLPVVSRFHEVNLRTYVHRGGREPGVWFLSLDATSRPTVVGARAWFRLAYHFARIRMEIEPGTQVRFESDRLWPGPTPAGCSLRYRPSGPVRLAEPGSLEYFLTERYILYAGSGDGLRQGRVAHEPYPLQPGEVDAVQETLSEAASVPSTRGDRLVHYASGVSVRIYPPVDV